MDVFHLREQLIQDYSEYASSFIQIRDTRIAEAVHKSLEAEVFWPDPLIQLNPMFETGGTIDELVEAQILNPECSRIFRKNKAIGIGQTLHLHRHQQEAIEIARGGHNYILTTGTGSGKSLAYIVPIVDHVLRRGTGRGIQAIIVYPMNALANSQAGELRKFLNEGYPEGQPPVTFARYTGQESEDERQHVIAEPPDILLTNYVMLELIMTRPRERRLIERARGLRFLVLDELHTYRGRQGADVALLLRRVRDRLETTEQKLLFVGTSATLASEGSFDQQRAQIAQVGTQMFGSQVEVEHIIGETLRRTTRPYRDADAFGRDLTATVRQGSALTSPTDYRTFVAHPLSIWIEDAFGLRAADGRLVRQEPRSLQGENGVAHELSRLTGADQSVCVEVIRRWLLAGYQCQPDLETGFSPFAFRLHQFISPGDSVYATVEPEATRHITLNGQRFVPGDRERVLFPLCFCRECGQEYYVVRITTSEGRRKVMPREFRDYAADDESDAGYLYLNTENPWPRDLQELIERDYLPDDWLEERNGVHRVRGHRRSKLPQHIRVLSDGDEDDEGQECVYISSPFMFCLNCGVSYAARQSEFGKLATLSSEGRSSATTLLSLSAIRALKTSDLDRYAQKLLSFTDNRQDASL